MCGGSSNIISTPSALRQLRTRARLVGCLSRPLCVDAVLPMEDARRPLRGVFGYLSADFVG